MTTIPYGRQSISDADIDAVVEVLRSDFLTQGPVVPAFERAVAAYCVGGRGAAVHAVAVNSGTSALHLACVALGLRPGDRLWTSPVTFAASANCARYCGADVEFVDIDPHTYTMSADRLATRLAEAAAAGRLPAIIVAVHLCGQACDMAAIQALARQYGVRVIEDAAHALGGRYRGEPIGNGRYSDVTVFSFHPVKSLTTGEGGMALTRDAALADRMRLLRSHGITRDEAAMTHASDGPWYYEQVALGFNYRLTDLQAALGISQLARLDSFIDRRRAIARRYDEALVDLPLATPWQHPDSDSARHLYVVRLHRQQQRRGHREVFEGLRAAGIGVNLHYIPVYRLPYYAAFGYDPARYPEAERYYAEAISLPIYPGLDDAAQTRVIEALVRECEA